MAVEIKELVIRAVIDKSEQQNRAGVSKAELTPEQAEAIIEACIKEVLKIIERKNSR